MCSRHTHSCICWYQTRVLWPWQAQLQQEVSNLEAAQEKIAANEAESVSAVSQKIAQLQAPAEQEVTPAEPSNAEDEDNEDSKATERYTSCCYVCLSSLTIAY